MNSLDILERELRASFEFFRDYTNLKPNSPGFGLTIDTTREPEVASIAAVGFALTAWVIADRRGYLGRAEALDIARGTLRTLLERVPHIHGFFAHFVHMDTAERVKRCEYSTIDTALCLNGVITASAHFDDPELSRLAQRLLERVDWRFIVFERDGTTLFRMAYNPDRDGDYVEDEPGYLGCWDMAAEQKMMYLLAVDQVEPEVARRLYAGFSRDTAVVDGRKIIHNPGGNLFAYQFSEAWLDTARYLDPDGVDWFENTRLATLANRDFCLAQAHAFKTYGPDSWGISAGDSPWGYDVSGAPPLFNDPNPNGTVSIYGALSALPFAPELTLSLVHHLYHEHPQTWGRYGFFDAYNLAVSPPWYSQALYGIDKGCSMIMIENHLSRLVWETYTNSPLIQHALGVLGFTRRETSSSDD